MVDRRDCRRGRALRLDRCQGRRSGRFEPAASLVTNTLFGSPPSEVLRHGRNEHVLPLNAISASSGVSLPGGTNGTACANLLCPGSSRATCSDRVAPSAQASATVPSVALAICRANGAAEIVCVGPKSCPGGATRIEMFSGVKPFGWSWIQAITRSPLGRDRELGRARHLVRRRQRAAGHPARGLRGRGRHQQGARGQGEGEGRRSEGSGQSAVHGLTPRRRERDGGGAGSIAGGVDRDDRHPVSAGREADAADPAAERDRDHPGPAAGPDERRRCPERRPASSPLSENTSVARWLSSSENTVPAGTAGARACGARRSARCQPRRCGSVDGRFAAAR